DRPARLVLRKRGSLDHLVAGDPIPIFLPIAGHTASTTLDPGAIYSLETDAPDPEVAFVAALPAHVTDATGHALLRRLAPRPRRPPGHHLAAAARRPARPGRPRHRQGSRGRVDRADHHARAMISALDR